jgi:hypothetical protein
MIIVVPLLWGVCEPTPNDGSYPPDVATTDATATPPFRPSSHAPPHEPTAAATNLGTSAMGGIATLTVEVRRSAKRPLSFNARLQPVIAHARYLVGC